MWQNLQYKYECWWLYVNAYRYFISGKWNIHRKSVSLFHKRPSHSLSFFFWHYWSNNISNVKCQILFMDVFCAILFQLFRVMPILTSWSLEVSWEKQLLTCGKDTATTNCRMMTRPSCTNPAGQLTLIQPVGTNRAYQIFLSKKGYY